MGHRDQVEIGFPIGVERPDITPILDGLFVGVLEIECVYPAGSNHARNDVSAEVVRSILLRIGDQFFTKTLGAKQIDSHRGEGFRRIAGNVGRIRGLFLEFFDREILVDAHDAEALAFFYRNVQGADDDVRVLGNEPMKHFHVVHFINVIPGEDEDVFRLIGVEQEQVLIHGVRGAPVPFLADPLLRWNGCDEFAEFGVIDVPTGADMPVQ